ncbi:Cytochrome P450 [Actinopolyspora lacussalsi subsp. righensis]|uniref:Cytochrome P450 n=1 Tax=Actinopolyspora righensis TaxID=995060 RepID=A0A1I6XDQ9_9ACTN|nr:cytochrome P450 [Actinopolyspora righensis]SFT35974.1 Cytochrome P450 [Actinopolyspora righensis]
MTGSARRVPPGPPRRATPGLLRKLVKDRLSLLSEAAANYGDAVRLRVGPKTLYFFNHPEYAKHILADNSGNYTKGIGYIQARRALGDGLLTSDGALWRTQRKTVQPTFQHKRIAAQADAIVDEAARLVDRLRAHEGGGPVDVVREMTGFSLGVLGRTLLDTDLGAYKSIGGSFEAVQNQAMFEMESMGLVPMWVPLPRQLRFRRARRDLRRIVEQLVVQRLADPRSDGDDALSRLIRSTERETDSAVGRRRLHDELTTLLLTGHETTASTLGWTFSLLDQHPEVASRLHTEAVEVLGDRLPTYEDLHRLTYTSMVVQESIRLFPPVWILPRQSVSDDVIGGYHVPAGSDVLVCPYTLHRHPDFWESPNRFDPERFASDNTADRPRYAHIPFGAGPRFCVGNHLGLMEATFVLAMVAREMRLDKVENFEIVAEPMLSLRLRGGLPMTVRNVSPERPAPTSPEAVAVDYADHEDDSS